MDARYSFSFVSFFIIFAFNCPTIFAQPASSSLVRRVYETTEIKVDKKKHDEQFFNFITRPDIDAPRWNVKTYDEVAVSPGYWFTAPYGIVSQSDHDKAYVGPHIYDNNGELVWSGVPAFNGYNVFDFKVLNVEGKDMLSMIYPYGNGSVILDDNYNVYKTIHTGENKVTLNMHDFQTVNNGTTALFLNKVLKETSEENSLTVDYHGHCNAEFPGFEERDLKTGEVLFKWSPEGLIGLDESTVRGARRKCRGRDPWDYLHSNSIEKLPDGDYLMSGRRSYALYKISHKDGSIVWRLGGKKSDFEWTDGGHFSGQHDARFISQNATHMLVSVMDNASGPGFPKKTNDFSRGLVIALKTNTQPMTAEIVKHFDHPHKDYAPARGNFQTLSNGNAFLCWTTAALQSEHTPDGKVIMEAKLSSGLKSYRSYKFPWVGRPASPPDVHSAAITQGDKMLTVVHVSWNGATEVRKWNLYKTSDDGQSKQLVASVPKRGFETAMVYRGYASHVIVEAVGDDGQSLGTSRMVNTISSVDQLHPDVVKETQWLQDTSGSLDNTASETPALDTASTELSRIVQNPVLAFVSGVTFTLSALLTIWLVWLVRCKGVSFWRQKKPMYSALWNSDDERQRLHCHKGLKPKVVVTQFEEDEDEDTCVDDYEDEKSWPERLSSKPDTSLQS